MELLAVMVTLALDMVIAVGMAFWVSSSIIGSGSESVTSMAMQQGGLGLLMTLLLISVPPMAAAFFQGTLGHFTPYSAFNQQPMQQTRPGQAGGGYHPAGAPPAPAASPSGANVSAPPQAPQRTYS